MDIHEQEQAKEEREAARRRRELIDAADFKAVIATVEGRRFIRRLIGECGVYRGSFTGDAQSAAYREGKRAVGLFLIGLFDGFPDQYIQLLTEKANDRDSEH